MEDAGRQAIKKYGSNQRLQSLLVLLLILACSFLLYANIFDNGFVWDDTFIIQRNDEFRKWENAGQFFTQNIWHESWGHQYPYYRPMFPFLILLISTFSGANPIGYHLASVMLHALVTWLFFLFLKRLGVSRWVVFVATAVFLIHPIHVEAVAWAVCAPILLGACCCLLILLGSTKLAESAGAKRIGLIIGCLVLFLLGFMTYDLAFSIPLVVLIVDLLKVGSPKRSKTRSVWVAEYGGYILVLLLILVVRSNILSQAGLTVFSPPTDPVNANVLYEGVSGERILAPFNIVSRYVGLMLFPANLSADYYFSATKFTVEALAALALMVVICCLMVRQRQRRRLLAFSLFWIIVSLIPVAHLIPQGGAFAERYLYFASLGFCLWAGLATETMNLFLRNRFQIKGRSVAVMLVVTVLLFLGTKTVLQNRVWQDDLTFWIETSVVSPHKPRVQNALGWVLLEAGRPEKAIEHFEKAIQLFPDYELARNNLELAQKFIEINKSE